MTGNARGPIAEALGTGLLVAMVVGSGIMAGKLSDGNMAVALLANALATGCGLAALILALAPVSGAHFNPLVSLSLAVDKRFPWRRVPAYAAAQILGAFAGTVCAHLMFDLPPISVSSRVRSGTGQWLGEFIATAGLLLVIRGCSRQAKRSAPFAVAAYIIAAYWFTSSTSFANPAVTLARTVTDTFAGIRPADAPGFMLAQAGAFAFSFFAWRWLMPVKNLLFVCIENSNRSQMAEAFARIHGGAGFVAHSSGSRPSGVVNPKAIAAMGEIGYDLSRHGSKSLQEIPDIEYDAVVTMGCGDACPFVRAKRREDWQIPDPKHLEPEAFRQVRDRIESKVKALLDEMG